MAIPDGGAAVAPARDLAQVVAALRRALALSRRGLGRVSPNPAVGCVLLDRAGTVAGEGWHVRAGGAHAEVLALQDAAARAAGRPAAGSGPTHASAGAGVLGGTAVVTLEPCAHTGRTGPCTTALLAAGISRVVYAAADPVHCGGAEALRRAGVRVHGPGSLLVPEHLAAEAAAVNEAWSTAQRTGRPHLTWKFAATLDGRSAAADGTSRWITGSAARADAHQWRDRADAVLVGAGTQRADDPALTVRPAPADGRQPLRVVLDPRGRTRPGARVLDQRAPTMLVLADGVRAPELPAHVQVARVRLDPGQAGPPPNGGPHDRATLLDPAAVLELLYRRGLRSVLLEGGPRLAGSFLAAGLVDRVIGYLAPALLGAGPAALDDAGVLSIAGTHRLGPPEVRMLGTDLRLTARVLPRAQETATRGHD
ncbi:bifunctional diaminohydroxyphosphoribosylaminopyrimidine deaminase/5-amino-6-(5-phosphoribosylamino)uracil reductase RibD [Ruania albidiflava]|uniref:bifunctional diaminohydroxyphosphoribosylaminopyrimidine deaminase/5-amino-6-(5-phosphoribosylamino)uracil reductase RibD n=1 Tax=Ruania albidiflava TaxID=366586 RepID=UPI0030B8E793